jgi:NACHT domain
MPPEPDSMTNSCAVDDSCIFWINGSAGTGKTTIAYTVAEVCKRYHVLGASFFCSRDDAECSNPRLIFTTIAHQLAMYNSLFRDQVAEVLRSQPDIGSADVSFQLEELIVNPLCALGSSFSPCLVILDALDECKESGITSLILSSLSRHVDKISSLCFLVTSRPESHITTAFKCNPLNSVTQKLILHEVQLDIVQNDIQNYLSSRFTLTRLAYHGLEETWPNQADIQALAQLSAGLFIFAATSVRFIEDPNYSNPAGQLATLLSNQSGLINPSSPYHHLDQLYIQVLDKAFPNMSDMLSQQLKKVLGTIVFLQNPLCLSAVASLLSLESDVICNVLSHLQSIVLTPKDDGEDIRLLHPSFADFITDLTRCNNPKLWVCSRTQHTRLACVCLEAMMKLHKNMCDLQNPILPNEEIKDLQERINKHIPQHLQYACQHWAWHLSNGVVTDNILKLLQEFCFKQLLYWVEVCSLMGSLRNALIGLESVQQTLKVGFYNVY